MTIKKYLIAITIILIFFFGALAVIKVNKHTIPAGQSQHVELASLIQNVEKFTQMRKLYDKKVRLHKLKQEIKELDEVPQVLLNYKKYLKDEIDKILEGSNV